MKFKVGDRVAITASRDGDEDAGRVGKVLTVSRITEFSESDYYVEFYENPEYCYHSREDCLELESVYNSPLYKALS